MKDRAAGSVLTLLCSLALAAAMERCFLADAWRAATVPAAVALLYGTVGFGVLRSRTWARWMGVGLAATGLVWFAQPPFGFIEVGFVPLIGRPLLRTAVSLAHLAPMLILARSDRTPWQISMSWMAVGACLLPALWLGLDALFFSVAAARSTWTAVTAVSIFLVSARAIAKERTWGLFGALLAGVLLYGAYPAGATRCDLVLLSSPSLFRHLAIGLVLTSAPFWPAIARRLAGR